MAAIGNRRGSNVSSGYVDEALLPLTKTFATAAKDILTEQGVDIFLNPSSALMLESARQTLKQMFIDECADQKELSPEKYEEACNDMAEQFENDCEALLEYAPMSQFNPVIGMTFPIHKNILMNNIFDKGAIPKFVAREPKFTLTMETRILVDPMGNEIDMFLEQNKMYDAIESTAPVKDTVLALPEMGTTDILATTFGIVNSQDANLSIETYVSALLVNSYVLTGETYYDLTAKEEKVAAADGVQTVWAEILPAHFTPYYGDYDRVLMGPAKYKFKELDSVSGEVVEKEAVVTLSGNTVKNKFTIMCSDVTNVKACKLSSRLDTSSAMLRTCQTRWKTRTNVVEIPNAIPINTPISPEEVKDVGALYNVNQLNKIMSLIKLSLGNYKDDKILKFLNDSFKRLPDSNRLSKTFDFAPREGYYSDHVEWRHKTFMDALDTHATTLIQVLNDPNVTISVIGNADFIRKITPTEYTYQTPSNIGPVTLEFTKTVTTSDRRVYNFISSDKLRDNKNLIIILCPRNTERIIYRIYDYQLYVSNEIRNYINPSLPAIHAFERFKLVEYQPVQARLKILNPTGMRDYVENTDPIGVNRMNNYTMNFPEGYNKLPKNIPNKIDYVDPNYPQPGMKEQN